MAQSVEHILGKDEVTSSILVSSSKRKSTAKAVLFLLERCVPQAERDAHCVRDAGFARDAHLRCVIRNALHHLSQRSGITYHFFCFALIYHRLYAILNPRR